MEHGSEGGGQGLRPIQCDHPVGGPPARGHGGRRRLNLRVGHHNVAIPDDALRQDEDFEMSAMPRPRIGVEVAARGRDRVDFRKPVTLVLSYRGCPKPKGAGPYTIARVRPDGSLVDVGGTDDEQQMTVTTTVDRFSGYLVAG